MLDVPARNALIHRLRSMGWSLRRIANHEQVGISAEAMAHARQAVAYTHETRRASTAVRQRAAALRLGGGLQRGRSFVIWFPSSWWRWRRWPP